MNDEKFPISDRSVGYIVRGKLRKEMPPLEDPIHADCILPGGHIAGYIYNDDSYYEGNFLNQSKLKGLEGEICFNENMAEYYRNEILAKRYRILSTFLLFDVQPHQARAFSSFWDKLRESPPSYNRLFKNCSTLCYEAYVKAGILDEGIFSALWNSVMTPSRLYQALIEKYSNSEANLITRTGYFGIDKDKKVINLLKKTN